MAESHPDDKIIHTGCGIIMMVIVAIIWWVGSTGSNSGTNLMGYPSTHRSYSQTQADERDARARTQEIRTERYLHSQQELKKAIDYVNATD